MAKEKKEAKPAKEEPAKGDKKDAKKESKPKKPPKYTVVITPVKPTIEVVEGKEELIEALKQHASVLHIPEHAIVECGLLRVFKGEEVKLSCPKRKIGLPS